MSVFFLDVFLTRARKTHEVLEVIHDVGKSDEFRKVVNDTLPPHQRTDDHDKALSNVLWLGLGPMVENSNG